MLLLKLALRNIFRQKRRSLLTALSMAGGYILCAFSISTTEGSYSNVIDLFTLDHTGHIQIHKDNYLQRPKIYITIDQPDVLSEQLDANEKILSHTRRVFAPALAYSDTGNSPVKIVGADTIRELSTSRLAQKVTKGNYFNKRRDADGYFPAMIGMSVASTLSITVGDELILISQGADGSVANDIFIVTALIGKKNSADKLNVYIPLIAAQEFLAMPGKVHEISILLDHQKSATKVAASLEQELQQEFPNLSIEPWQVVEETFYKSMQSDKRGNRVGLGIIIFIVFIGVLNTVLMSVLERTREFGVLKAIGSRPFTIAKLIVLETSLLAIFSTLAGFLISIPIIVWFTLHGIQLEHAIDVGGVIFDKMRGEISLVVFAAPMIIIVFFAILVSILPGLRAARVSPSNAMGSH